MIEYTVKVFAEDEAGLLGALAQISEELEKKRVALVPDHPMAHWHFYGKEINVPWSFYVKANTKRPPTPEEEEHLSHLLQDIGFRVGASGDFETDAAHPSGPDYPPIQVTIPREAAVRASDGYTEA